MQQPSFTTEQNQRLSDALSFLGGHWGEMQNMLMSSKGAFGSFVNIPGPPQGIFAKLGAKIYLQHAVPQRRGGEADMVIVVGVLLPHDVHFSAKARPALVDGMFNLDIELMPTQPDAAGSPALREVYLGVCEDILGKELGDPEFLAYVVRRQFDRYNEKRWVMIAEIARLVAEEIAHASTPRN